MFAAKREPKTMESILRDLCSPAELEAMADRLYVLPLIKKELPYRQIHKKSGVSITTIGRVAHHLRSGHGGYATLMEEKK